MRALPLSVAAALALFPVACGPAETPAPPSPEAGEGTVASADGVPIHYRTAGQGSPALVFVHGWACDSTYWDAQFRAFEPRQQVVALDLAGHGASGDGRSEWTVPAFAADVLAVLEALDLHGAVLIGHSLGAPVVIEAARQAPDRVAAVIAVGSLNDVEFHFGPAELEEFLAPFEHDFHGATEDFARNLFGEEGNPALATEIAADMASAPPELSVAALRALLQFDLAGAIEQVGVPILAINPPSSPTDVAANLRHAPQFQLLETEGGGHFPMREQPTRFNRKLEEALARVTGGARG